MANKFLFTFSAVDKTASVFKKVNASFSRSEKLTGKLTKQTKLGTRADADRIKQSKKFGDINSAFGGQQGDPFASFRAAGQSGAAPAKETSSALGNLSQLAEVVSPMAAAALAVAGAAAALAVSWGKAGVQLKNVSLQTGLSTDDIQLWAGTAKQAGLNADGMTQSLAGLRNEMNEIAVNRDNKMRGILFQPGTGMTEDDLQNVNAMIPKLAQMAAAMPNVQGRHTFLQNMGLTEDGIQLVLRGAAAIAQYREEAQAAAVANRAAQAAAEELGRKLGGLGNAWDGLVKKVEAGGAKVLGGSADYTRGLLTLDPKLMGKGYLEFLGLGGTNGSHAAGAAQETSGKLRLPSDAQASVSSLGLRSNNPMNLEPGGKHSWFGSMQDGLEAGISNLVRNYSGMTLDAGRSKYATATGDAHDNAVGVISKVSGVGRNQVPDLNDLQQLVAVVMGIIQAENGKNSITKEQVTTAAQHVLVTLHAPPGTTASATQGGKIAPVRIVHAMSPTP